MEISPFYGHMPVYAYILSCTAPLEWFRFVIDILEAHKTEVKE